MSAKTNTTTTKTTKATRKNTPKVTNKQRRMNEAERTAWKASIGFDKLDAALQASIDAKLSAAMTVRGEGKTGKTTTYDQAWVDGLSLIQALSIKGLVDKSLTGRQAEKDAEKAKIKAQIEALQATSATLEA